MPTVFHTVFSYFLQGLGSFTLGDSLMTIEGSLLTGSTVEARHPEKLTFHEAIVNKIQDQSQYTVVFDDGDIATLRQVAKPKFFSMHFFYLQILVPGFSNDLLPLPRE